MKAFIACIFVLLLLSCETQERGTTVLYSEHEGCRVYRVLPGGCTEQVVYYSDCGDTHWEVMEGKIKKRRGVLNGGRRDGGP